VELGFGTERAQGIEELVQRHRRTLRGRHALLFRDHPLTQPVGISQLSWITGTKRHDLGRKQ
jgi:hypothetical protein